MPDNEETNLLEDRPSQPESRKRLTVILVAALALMVAVVGVLVVKKMEREDSASVFTDYCAPTHESEFERSKMLYTDARYLTDEPVQVAETEGENWCVIEPSNAAGEGMFWGILYVGEDNPLYQVMVSESGDDDNSPRAVVTYQGVPPVKFARDGWVGFTTPSDEQWSAFKTGAGLMLLQRIADQAAGKEVSDV